MAKHETVEKPQVRKFLPFVAGHLPQHGALPVNDLIMRERQNKILGKGINQAEGDQVVMITAKDWVLRHVVEHVVHPTHVPLESKPEASEISRPRYLRPGRRLFSDHHRLRKGFVNALVHRPQKMNRVYIFLPAITISHPFTPTPPVINTHHP